ncbi:MAG TPA: hypothetical protein VK154_03460 [Chitinophagales bacterium]|nr:hypothetical protein [Chitinophagales bacterium]
MATFLHAALYTFYLALFLWLIFRWSFFKVEGTPKAHFAFFFLLKVAAGVALTLVYTYYYTDQQKADIYRYFNDSRVISPLLFTDPAAWLKIMTGYHIDDPGTFLYLINTHYFSHPGSDIVTNNTFIIRVNVLLNYLSFTNIYINTLLLNFISFASLTLLYRLLAPYFTQFSYILYIPIFLLPSVVFWSSGLLKEALLFTCLGPFFYYGANAKELPLYKYILGMAAGLLMLFIKLQVGFFAIMSLFLCMHQGKRLMPVWLRLSLFAAMCAIGIYFGGSDIVDMLINKRNEFAQLAVDENAGSFLSTPYLEPTATNLIALMPQAMVNAMLRPFVWEGSKLFQLVFAIENTLFLLMLTGLLFFFKRPTAIRLQLCLCFLFFALANYLVIGITVPVMGAIVHYRVIATPFLLLAVLLAVDLERLKSLVRGR